MGSPCSKKWILLPLAAGVGFVLETWKVKEGTLVRSGETVALACLANARDSGESFSSTGPALPGAVLSHKRPSRRKLARPSTAAAAPSTLSRLIKPYADNDGDRTSPRLLLGKRAEAGTPADSKKGAGLVNETCFAFQAGSSKQNEKDSKPVGETQRQKYTPVEAPISGFVRITSSEDNPRAIGFIEPCSHPAIVGNMCAVCGTPIEKKSEASENVPAVSGKISKAQSMHTSQITVSGGLTFEVSKDEQVRMGKQNARRLRQLKKLSLVLDLDATLVHATGDIRAQQHLGRKDVRSIVLPGSEDARGSHCHMQHFVKLRPNVKEFLEGVREGYEIGVYTAGTRQYAEQIAIMLCRHLVGAERDQIQLDQLKHRAKEAERQMTAIKAAKPVNAPEHAKAKEGKAEEECAVTEPEMKRRKVTFAEPEKHLKEIQKKPAITAEELLTIRREWEESEGKEKEASELRKRLFGSRIVSRSDVGDLGRDVKSLSRIFPCGGIMAAVVDDREDVWANAKDNISGTASSRKGEPPENLLLVEAYHWEPFTGFADINNASGLSLSNCVGRDKLGEEHDEQLLWTKDILKRLHARFYSQGDGNVKTVPEILSEMRKEVLLGKNIVLSGLIPLHKQGQFSDQTRPRPDPIRYVESMGATIFSKVHAGTSFVVAARDGTDKILAGRRTPGCYVVKRSWLMQCFWSLTRRDPKPHILQAAGRDASLRCTAANLSPERDLVTAEKAKDYKDEDSDESDDELAVEFEKDFM